jgi:valyl-tRNA synthetase
MMQPKMAEKIGKATKKQFPDGINAFGTDALRFTFAAMASTSRDINFDMGRVEGYRNFCNKIWNATRFVLMNTEEFDAGKNGGDLQLSVFDRWIWSQFQETLKAYELAISQYRFDIAAQHLYEFTWNQFCDWYLELSKPILNSENSSEAEKRGTRHTLINVLEHMMRLLHPFMPYITEEIWQKIVPLSTNQTKAESIMVDAFPVFDQNRVDQLALDDIEWVKSFIVGIRNIRGEMDIAPSKPLPVLLKNVSETDQAKLDSCGDYLAKLAKLESVVLLSEGEKAPASATAMVGEMEILIPMAGLIDKDAELARLNKAAEKIEKDAQRTKGKLSNENFVSKAPEAVIEKERAKLADMEMQLSKISAQKAEIEAI